MIKAFKISLERGIKSAIIKKLGCRKLGRQDNLSVNFATDQLHPFTPSNGVLWGENFDTILRGIFQKNKFYTLS
jgi:hypothetical protein